MTYTAYDSSAQSGSPLYLVQFSNSSGDWYFNQGVNFITYNSQTWEPAPFNVGSINHSNDFTKDTISITAPRNHTFFADLLADSYARITTVTVFRGHLQDGDSEYVVYWKGRIASVSAKKDEVELKCDPVFTSLKRPGLRARFQKTCRHALYSGACGLNAAGLSSTGTVTSVTGTTLIVTGADALGSGYFTGGMIGTSSGELLFILSQSGTTLKLMRISSAFTQEFIDSSGSLTVDLYPGCDHTINTCISKFNNLANFGGFPWIPNKNPMGGSSIV